MELFRNLHELEWLPAGQAGEDLGGQMTWRTEHGPTWDFLP